MDLHLHLRLHLPSRGGWISAKRRGASVLFCSVREAPPFLMSGATGICICIDALGRGVAQNLLLEYAIRLKPYTSAIYRNISL